MKYSLEKNPVLLEKNPVKMEKNSLSIPTQRIAGQCSTNSATDPRCFFALRTSAGALDPVLGMAAFQKAVWTQAIRQLFKRFLTTLVVGILGSSATALVGAPSPRVVVHNRAQRTVRLAALVCAPSQQWQHAVVLGRV